MHYAQNKVLKLKNNSIPYVTFGRGDKTLVIIPGLGDGLKSVKGMAFLLSMQYHAFAKDYRVYIFSRKSILPKNCSSLSMAQDLKEALDLVGIKKADFIGISQGGTIAQQLALHYPEVIGKLVLTVTFPRINDTLEPVIHNWIRLAKKKDYRSLFIDVTERFYMERSLRMLRPFYPIITKYGATKSFDKFINMAIACLTHDVYDQLGNITVPTLVVGGRHDITTSAEASRELASAIPNAKLHIYKNYGHAVYYETPAFHKNVLEFLK